MIRILIADDHAIVRSGLKQIVTHTPDLTVVGEATSSQELLTLARQQPWDLIILDIHMPGRGGLETLKDLKREFPKLPVLILSMYPEDQYAVRAIKAGASGYLSKDSAPDELLTAIHKILRGGKYISSIVAEHLATAVDAKSDKAPHELLSDREYQILCLIASGKTVGEIAVELNLSVKTVSTHRGRILDKMQMKTSAELTHYAIRNQLV
ncbi:MAG: response regulator transcription factor [Acidobacteria bacterium]|nr:response regulator transcription factor [Acidobacteriota bacterium]MBI3425005.1 response regulator transcription factor [Acidobacteriota bacterium]